MTQYLVTHRRHLGGGGGGGPAGAQAPPLFITILLQMLLYIVPSYPCNPVLLSTTVEIYTVREFVLSECTRIDLRACKGQKIFQGTGEHTSGPSGLCQSLDFSECTLV